MIGGGGYRRTARTHVHVGTHLHSDHSLKRRARCDPTLGRGGVTAEEGGTPEFFTPPGVF